MSLEDRPPEVDTSQIKPASPIPHHQGDATILGPQDVYAADTTITYNADCTHHHHRHHQHDNIHHHDDDHHVHHNHHHVHDDDDDDEEETDLSDDSDVQSSTTSTSSTNNRSLNDSPKVCDCCYCEVFGHGPGQGSQTSRKYNEIRDRLRGLLSRRRAERCEKVSQKLQQNGNSSKDDSSNDKGGGPLGGDQIDDTSKPPPSVEGYLNRTNGENKQPSSPVVDQRNLDELLSFINGDSREKSSGKRKDSNSNKNIKYKVTNGKQQKQKSAQKSAKDKTTPTTTTKSKLGKNLETPNSKSVYNTSAKEAQSSCKKSSALSDNDIVADISSRVSQKRPNIAKSVIASNKTEQHVHMTDTPKGDNVQKKEVISNCNENEIPRSECSNSKPEDVFTPRDIDLEDGQLDELERELELFKRFCFDSVPLTKKEKVRIHLKNANIFKANVPYQQDDDDDDDSANSKRLDLKPGDVLCQLLIDKTPRKAAQIDSQ